MVTKTKYLYVIEKVIAHIYVVYIWKVASNFRYCRLSYQFRASKCRYVIHQVQGYLGQQDKKACLEQFISISNPRNGFFTVNSN